MVMKDLIVGGMLARRAFYFAAGAHGGQLRKYTNEPYFVHPLEVARIVASVPHTDEMLAAAFLHDVEEDTSVPHSTIIDFFGRTVAEYVFDLTDYKNASVNRAARKELDRKRLAAASPEVQTIKVADLISNTSSIVQHDPKFAEIYLQEKAALLEVLVYADPILLDRAKSQLIKSQQQLELV